MQPKKTAIAFLITGGSVLLAITLYLMTATPVKAQCGSQASSCKNCHEVQAQLPVNSDGTGWHQSHAFGDFCYICHAGNNQAKEKAAAHEGMVEPLSDVQASCQQCHAADLQERARVYASILNVSLGNGSPAAAPAPNLETAATTSNPTQTTENQSCAQLVVDDPNAVNYVQTYDELVLGKKPTNWGNVILMGMIGLMLAGGGGFVITREKWINVKFGDTRRVDEEYPADVVAMLPKIAGLKPDARKSLNKVLENKRAHKVLDLMDAVIEKDEE